MIKIQLPGQFDVSLALRQISGCSCSCSEAQQVAIEIQTIILSVAEGDISQQYECA